LNFSSQELKNRAVEAGVSGRVRFLPSITDKRRNELLNECQCLLYTPSNEHFGIVPLEAALASKPVIACKSGGPLETVVDGRTGFLREPDAAQWADAVRWVWKIFFVSAFFSFSDGFEIPDIGSSY
jgi:alpha-1,3/alpha-1,6-mannosyltransferase